MILIPYKFEVIKMNSSVVVTVTLACKLIAHTLNILSSCKI